MKTSQASSGVSCKPTSIPSYLSSLSRCRPDVSIAILQLLMNGRFQGAYPYNNPSVPLTPLLEPRASLYLFSILPLRTPLQSFSYSRQLDDSSKPIRATILPYLSRLFWSLVQVSASFPSYLSRPPCSRFPTPDNQTIPASLSVPKSFHK